MTPNTSHSDESHERAVTGEEATRLLPIAIAGPRRPIDAVIERLRQPDANKWLQSILRAAAERMETPESTDAHALLAEGEASLEQIRALKEQSKSELRTADPDDPPAPAVFLYFIAVAAALAHHSESISSMPREEIDPILVDLADAAPEPWSELCLRAAMSAASPSA